MYLSKHYLCDFYECNKQVLANTSKIEELMLNAAEICSVTIIKPFFHTFSPHGVSGIIIIAESHFAIHTWPEHNFAAVDLFSCSDFAYEAALAHIASALESKTWHCGEIERGTLSSAQKSHLSMRIL